VKIFDPRRLLLIAGPCSLESLGVCVAVADKLAKPSDSDDTPPMPPPDEAWSDGSVTVAGATIDYCAVAGTLMVEPTESETLTEVDAFCEAMIAIRGEIDKVGAGEWTVDDNPLRGAPHTAECLVVDKWEHPYTRELAAYPLGKGFRPKVWPPVRRIDGAYGDRNLVCSCPPVEAFA